MAKYDWKIEPRDEDWSDDKYAYFLIHINIKRMAEYLNKEFKKDWWFKADYGQDYVWIVAENNNFPVRLFFNFDEDGWANIKRHYTDGASYKDESLGNWHFAKYDVDYSFDMIKENIKEYFDRFEEGKKMNKSLTEGKNTFDDDFKSLAEWKLGDDKERFYKIVNKMDIDELVKYLGDWWVLENQFDANDTRGMNYTFFRSTWGRIKVKTDSKNKVVFVESNKTNKKSLKEGYRTMGFIQTVRDTIVDVLEDPHSDLFDLGYCDGIITYDNKGRARITSNGDVDMDFITLPTYFYSSGYTPSNKKTAKLVDDIMDMNFENARERLWDENKDELIALGITSKDDEKLNYNDLYDMGEDGLANELSEYEMDIEGTDLYTDVFCELEETDEGIELTVSMTIQDEYGHALVKDYKSNTVLLQEDVSAENGDLEEFIEDAIKQVTEQF